MFNFFKKNDLQIQEDVLKEIQWDPSFLSADLNVIAHEGVVTLRGSVSHFYDKMLAEKAAQRVGGVRAVANEIEVNILGPNEKSDEDIAKVAINAMDWNYQIPAELKISVEKGWVTLGGEVEWDYQRNAAINTVNKLMGVRGVHDHLTIKSATLKADIKNRIEEALKRSAGNEARKIKVDVHGSKVTLSGDVHSFSESEDARYAAWNAPGIMTVENKLEYFS